MHKQTWTSTRSPDSFNDLQIIEVSQRVLLKQEGTGQIEWFEPAKMSIDLFKAKLSKLGKIRRFDQYFCPQTGLNVVRGTIVKEENREFFFSIFYPENDLYEQEALSTLRNLEWSGKIIE